MAQPREFKPFQPPPAIPQELLDRRQWIGWREWRNPAKLKPDKLPISIPTGSGIGYLEPANHVSYAEAVAAVGKLKLSGVGFVMVKGCGLTGGDLDGCVNPLTGEIEAWARALVELGETYFEFSPSGKGIRFFSLGELPRSVIFAEAGVELYVEKRFLTFTGNRLASARKEIGEAPKTVEALLQRVNDARIAAGLDPESRGGPGDEETLDFQAWSYRQTPMGRINTLALQNLDLWVPELFPGARRYQDGWRVSSADLGRGNEEDLSILPRGIKDWGVHDLGDPHEGKRSAIDLVLEWEPFVANAKEAAQWIAEKIGVPFDLPKPDPAPGPGPDDPAPDPLDPDADLWTQWSDALARLRRATPRPEFVSGGLVDAGATLKRFDPRYNGPVAIRPAITDRLTRGFVSMVSAAANAGKSTYLGAEALAIVTGVGAFLGAGQSLDWRGHALIVSNEESAAVLAIRWRGYMRLAGIDESAFEHGLTIWPTDDKKLRIGKVENGAVTPTRDGVAFVNALAGLAEAGEPAAFVGMDTLVSLFEGVEENSASEMDKAVGLVNAIAAAGFLAIDLVHHTGKSGATEAKTSYRGSSAIFAAVAEMSTLVPLPAEEAEALGMSPAQAAQTLRMMGQRQRDGMLPGVWYFEREVAGLVAQDPRDPASPKMRTVAMLKAISAPTPAAAPTDTVDVAVQLLWDEQQRGRQIRRGGQGSKSPDAASAILVEHLGWKLARSKAKVDDMIVQKQAIVRHAKDPKSNVVAFLEIVKPPWIDNQVF